MAIEEQFLAIQDDLIYHGLILPHLLDAKLQRSADSGDDVLEQYAIDVVAGLCQSLAGAFSITVDLFADHIINGVTDPTTLLAEAAARSLAQATLVGAAMADGVDVQDAAISRLQATADLVSDPCTPDHVQVGAHLSYSLCAMALPLIRGSSRGWYPWGADPLNAPSAGKMILPLASLMGEMLLILNSQGELDEPIKQVLTASPLYEMRSSDDGEFMRMTLDQDSDVSQVHFDEIGRVATLIRVAVSKTNAFGGSFTVGLFMLGILSTYLILERHCEQDQS